MKVEKRVIEGEWAKGERVRKREDEWRDRGSERVRGCEREQG